MSSEIDKSASALQTGRPSYPQLFGPLPIYSQSERSKRLAKDLAWAICGASLSGDGANLPLSVLFVARDSSPNDENGPEIYQDEFPRFYHAAFIERYGFGEPNESTELKQKPDKEPKPMSVFEWLSSLGLKEKLKKEDFESVVETIQPEESKNWEKSQTAQDAFERLVSTYSRIRYWGGTPTVLDRRLKDSEQAVFHIYKSKISEEETWVKVKYINKKTGKEDDFRCLGYEEPAFDEDIKIPAGAVTFPYEELAGKRETECEKFFAFCDGFFRVSDASSEADSFKGIVVPLYDRWEAGGPTGAFLGWVFIEIQDDALGKKCFDDLTASGSPNLHREILRANLNDYADSLSESVMDAEQKRYSGFGINTPIDYFVRRFHYIEGWTAMKGAYVGKEDYYDWSSSMRILWVCLGDSTWVALKPKFDTILPAEESQRRDYFIRITKWARTFWEGLKQLHKQQQVGLALGWEEHLVAMSHEARRLINRVRKNERGYVLDTLRLYLHSLLFTHSATDINKGGKLTPDRVRSQLGKPFAEETDLHSFLLAMLRQAIAIEWLGDWIPENAPFFRSRFSRYIENTIKSFEISQGLKKYALTGNINQYPHKVMVGCAVICVFRNILKHRDPDKPNVKVSLNESCGSLEFRNYGPSTINTQGVVTYSEIRGGTYGAVSRYLRQYLTPEEQKDAKLIMPGSPDFKPDNHGRFLSALPLPKAFLCQKSTS